MLHIVLVEPEIPPNTGNILRLARNTGCSVELVQPLGFEIDDARMRRAGLDYADQVSCTLHPDWSSYLSAYPEARRFTFSTKGDCFYADTSFQHGDHLIFGPETRGLPDHILDQIGRSRCLRLPMRPDSRSINLSNAVAVAVYEAWRQLGFDGTA